MFCYNMKFNMEDIMINQELKDYIENNIFPEYNKNEIGHGIEHIKYVIDRSFELVKENNFMLKGRKIDVKKAQPKSEQKTKNIQFQSGADVFLNKHK